jgi:hypothetical protein
MWCQYYPACVVLAKMLYLMLSVWFSPSNGMLSPGVFKQYVSILKVWPQGRVEPSLAISIDCCLAGLALSIE